METAQGKTKAWFSSNYVGPEDLVGATGDAIVGMLAYSSSQMQNAGWTYVGEARISVDLPAPKDLVLSKIESLRQQIKLTRADAEMACNNLTSLIQKLEAIEWNGRSE